MEKFYVHDFYFEDFDLEKAYKENNFCVSVNVYFSFSPENPSDGWDNLEFFNITVANPLGLAKYLNTCIEKGIFSPPFFCPYIIICNYYDKQEIINAIKKELHSIYGKNKKELLLKAIRKFSWESENFPEVYGKLFT